MTAPPRRLIAPILAVLVALALVLTPTGPAGAAPNPTPTPSAGAPADEDDGPPQLLRDVIESSSRNYLQAKAKVDQSKKRQAELDANLRVTQARFDALAPQVGEVASQSYRIGRVGVLATLLNSASPDSFVQRVSALDSLNMVNDKKVAAVNEAKNQIAAARAALDAELKQQQEQFAVMAKQKEQADKALALVGGNRQIGNGFVAATSPVARAAPRTADGGWPDESCSQNDPTTDGCITPRTLNAYNEVRRAGFNRFAGCHRNGGPFEHPKGRACDWSLLNKGFARASTKDQLLYGNNLAAFLIRNADRLGILYVIWYKQIWLPATGWKSYSGASDHTDHVHMSLI